MRKMDELATGLQHVGIPVKNIDEAVEFYKRLGFEEILRTVGQKSDEQVIFMKLKNLVMELYQRENTAGYAGAIDHIAIDVTDIVEAFNIVQKMGYPILEKSICSMPFWQNGVCYFTICGPQGERVEFNQIL